MLAQIVLMIGLGAVPGGGRFDGGGDGLFPFSRGVHARYHLFGRRLLLGSVRKQRGPVLGTDVVALAVERGGVVQFEEPLFQQIFVAQDGRIEGDPDGFGVAGLAVMGCLLYTSPSPRD